MTRSINIEFPMEWGLSIMSSEKIIEMAKNNAIAFLLGYMLATGELHLVIADLLSL